MDVILSVRPEAMSPTVLLAVFFASENVAVTAWLVAAAVGIFGEGMLKFPGIEIPLDPPLGAVAAAGVVFIDGTEYADGAALLLRVP
jgi:TPP-dependent indolepyruvate ferredoxin oxidoreductase alpha subunit